MRDADLGTLLPRTVTTPRGDILVRQAVQADADAVMRMHHRCSTETVFRRYFTVVPALSPVVQGRLMSTSLSLVATVGHEVVGMAHLVEDGPAPVEMAVLVEDFWQRMGLGRALAEAALDVAELWGLDLVVVHSLPSSGGAHALLRSLRSGALHPSFRTDADGFVETTIPLADARFRQPAPGSVAS
ncbi:MAG: GNAT family N-acetyltransferase [Actinobacteria bacterium]|jgi:GNAT superfamily N-acetyltransferase|nr:GNAT family N-acetyltransferase [Actinomycetota bacterium]